MSWKCPLWTDNKKLREQEVADAAAKAKEELKKKNLTLQYDPTAEGSNVICYRSFCTFYYKNKDIETTRLLRISLADKSFFPLAVDVSQTEPAASLLLPGDGQTVAHMVVIMTALSLLPHLLPTRPHPARARLHAASNKKSDGLVGI